MYNSKVKIEDDEYKEENNVIDEKLLEAVTNRDVKFIQNYKGDINGSLTEDGKTALMIAAYKGYPEIVKALISVKADVNAVNKYDWTPLMFAVGCGKIEVVKILIAAKADVNAVNKNNGATALNLANDIKNAEIIKILKKAGAK